VYHNLPQFISALVIADVVVCILSLQYTYGLEFKRKQSHSDKTVGSFYTTTQCGENKLLFFCFLSNYLGST
jgi:hypothetical protein